MLFFIINALDAMTNSPYVCACAVTLACLYNLLVLPMMIFVEFYDNYYRTWLAVNVLADLINVADIYFRFRRESQNQTENKSRSDEPYVRSYAFIADVVAILPTDLGLLAYNRFSLFRLNRLFKLYRISEFMHQCEIYINRPYIIQLLRLSLTCFAIFHWNGCIYFFLSIVYNFEAAEIGDWIFSYAKIPNLLYALCDTRRANLNASACLFDERGRNARRRELYLDALRMHWTDDRYNKTNFPKWAKKYQQSFYWSALTLVTLGEQPWPNNSTQSVFEIGDTLLGLLIFAAIIGDVGGMVSQINRRATNYEYFIDNCRRYINFRKVNSRMSNQIMHWFSYYRNQYKGELDEIEIYSDLSRALRRELAGEIHVPLLKRIPLFENCEEELLHEIVANFRIEIYNPGDFICHKGDIGKELFVVRHGELEVLDELTNTVVRRLNEGESFGELSLLSIAANKTD